MTYIIHLTKTERHQFDKFDLPATLKTWTDRGYSVTDVEPEDENKGCWVGFCEDCGMPLFENDDYQYDSEGVYWHEECPEAANGKS